MLAHESALRRLPGLDGADVRTSFLQRIPGSSHAHRALFPLYPAAVESFDLSPFDLVISSSHAAAKGVRTTPRQLHVCYCYTPMRWAWDLRDQYLAKLDPIRRAAASVALGRLRDWDRASSGRVDRFIAGSRCAAERIRRAYGRESEVLYPPVDVDFFQPGGAKAGHFIAVARLVGMKRLDLIVRAFNELRLPLVVIGEGPERRRLQRLAGPTVRLAGYVPRTELRALLASARALVAAAEEDFGIAPLEAAACGTPVVALAAGGALETIEHGRDGVFFHEPTVPALAAAIRRFVSLESTFDRERLRATALPYARERFESEFRSRIERAWAERRERQERLAAA
jgi:glycosyltransferase involved in cell wall biosynthesis